MVDENLVLDSQDLLDTRRDRNMLESLVTLAQFTRGGGGRGGKKTEGNAFQDGQPKCLIQSQNTDLPLDYDNRSQKTDRYLDYDNQSQKTDL